MIIMNIIIIQDFFAFFKLTKNINIHRNHHYAFSPTWMTTSIKVKLTQIKQDQLITLEKHIDLHHNEQNNPLFRLKSLVETVGHF